MSKIKNYDRALYESIEIGLRAVISLHRFVQLGEVLALTYTPKAYEEAMAFLCVNDIPHTFTYNPINSKLGARVLTVTWSEDDGTEKNLAWWEKKISSDCYMVRFEENWADEMDVQGFALFTAEEYSEWSEKMFCLRRAMENGGSFEYYFGTNEFNEYEDYIEFEGCFSVKVISAEHAKILRDVLKIQTYYGEFPKMADLSYYIEAMKRKETDE